MQHKSPEIGVIRSCLYRILRMQPLMTAYRACSPYGRTYTVTVFADILSRISYSDIRCTILHNRLHADPLRTAYGRTYRGKYVS